MRKLFLIVIVALGMTAFIASCEAESTDEQAELFSPDPDKVKPPGGGDG